MAHPPDEKRLEESLRRIERAIAPIDRDVERRVERQVRRAMRDRRKHKAWYGHPPHPPMGTPGGGIVQLVFSGALLLMVLIGVIPWWGLFIAFGLGMGGIKALAENKRDREEDRADDIREERGALRREPPVSAKPEAAWEVAQRERLARMEQRIQQLRTELREGSEVLREIVRRPEETLDGLEKGARALADREATLRRLVSPEEDARLERERQQLVQRRDAEGDPVTRQRLAEALAALDRHRQERGAVLTAANRLEAEQTRLLYSLETMHAQVLRARSMDASAVASDASLRQSLERLTDEIGAVAEALEAVAHPEQMEPIAPIAPEGNPRMTPDRDRQRD